MEYNADNNILTIFFSGHIDSSNASQVEEEVIGICDQNSGIPVVVDAEKLEYISSAGLRIVLKLLKKSPEFKIINAAPEVYDIFDMTGFTEMMTIEKAYKRVSVEGCDVIGRGANGEVYRLNSDTVIKLYHNPDCLPDIKNERELARKAFVLGIPTAISYDIVKVGDSYGSVFELLNAQSLSELISNNPDNYAEYAKIYIDLLKLIHSTEVKKGEMPDMKIVAVGWANFLKDYLPKEQFDKLIQLVNAVPDDERMMHGDYHTKNIMIQNGEVLLIDMDTLCTGNPVFELASMYLAYIGFSEGDPEQIVKFQGFSAETGKKFWRKSLELYFGTDDEEFLNKQEDKAKVIGYTRLLRRTIRRNSDDTETINRCKSRLAELLPKIDSLVFDK